MVTTGIRQCPFCCSGGAIVTALHVPKGMPPRYAVVCDECDAQGPACTTQERAIDEWGERVFDIDASPVESVDDLDDRLMMLAEHAKAVRDGIAAGEVDVERAVALGVVTGACAMLEGLAGSPLAGAENDS